MNKGKFLNSVKVPQMCGNNNLNKICVLIQNLNLNLVNVSSIKYVNPLSSIL